jgi:DNA polymerase I-like protein with 3'-5' exonuclease and polymerase domains
MKKILQQHQLSYTGAPIPMATVIIVFDEAEREYLGRLRYCLTSGSDTKLKEASKTTPYMMANACRAGKFAGVLVASESFLIELLKDPKAKRANYAGSLIAYEGVEFVILPSLIALQFIPHAPHVMSHYISKLTQPHLWPAIPEFSWTVGNNDNLAEIVEAYRSATMIAIDIETAKDPIRITMVGFTAVWVSGNSVRMHTTVVPFTFKLCTHWTQELCSLPAAKIFQGGRYDIGNLARYSIIVHNYGLDTMCMYHAWYAELPKDLGAIAAYCVRTARYWKDLAGSADGYDKLLYNALDCWNTANAMLYMLMRTPAWARENYRMKFPLIFPSHMCEMRGLKRDTLRFKEMGQIVDTAVAKEKTLLAAHLGKPGFNPNSPTQVKQLCEVLGVPVKSTAEAELDKIAYSSPWVAFFTSKITSIRGNVKLRGTYLDPDKDWKGRWFYALLPYGTETGRWSSGESAFWCGQSLHNIPHPEDNPIVDVRETVIADEGFRLFECDSEQAESRDTAHIAGDTKLIAAVTGSRDFHSLNTSAFFGVPYEEIYDDATHKKLDKPLRELGKRVNHGANYVMGEGVLTTTMGYSRLEFARKRLKLSKAWSFLEISAFLLSRFHATYPGLRGRFYPYVKQTIEIQKKLTGATGWTRYFFGDMKNKRHSNAAIAHGPQSLNAMRLDKAFMRIFLELAIHPTHSNNFKLNGQIHDSTLAQFRIGHEYLTEEVRKRMEVPITCTGVDGVTRTYIVPAAVKAGKDGKGAARWSDCE